jgi:hypothetical protein
MLVLLKPRLFFTYKIKVTLSLWRGITIGETIKSPRFFENDIEDKWSARYWFKIYYDRLWSGTVNDLILSFFSITVEIILLLFQMNLFGCLYWNMIYAIIFSEYLSYSLWDVIVFLF